MTAVELLRQQLKSAHDTMEATIGEATPEQLQYNELNKAIPAGAAYAHSVLAEDVMMSSMLMQKEPIFKGDTASIGISEAMPSMAEWEKHEEWYKTVKIDLPKFRKYAQDVYKASDEWLGTLSDSDLDKEEERPMIGKQNLGWLISNFLILHIANLTGEISAAKGFQGLKGYPF